MSREGPMASQGALAVGPRPSPVCLSPLWVLAHHTGLVAPQLAQLFEALINFPYILDMTSRAYLLSLDTVSPTEASPAMRMGKLRHRPAESRARRSLRTPAAALQGSLSLTDAFVSHLLPDSVKNHMVSPPRAPQAPLTAPIVHMSAHSCLSVCWMHSGPPPSPLLWHLGPRFPF